METKSQNPDVMGEWLVEPLSKPKPLGNSLAVAKSILRGEKGFIAIEVMNSSWEDSVLRQGTHAVMLQPVSII